MARQRSTRSTGKSSRGRRRGRQEPATPQPPADQRASPDSGPRPVRSLSSKAWIGIYLATFLLVELVLLLTFVGAGGESRIQKKMLSEAARYEEAGDWEAASDLLVKFANRFPGAWDNRFFTRRLGEAYLGAGEYRRAAEQLTKSVRLDPEQWDVHALAGQALWLAGNKEQAAPYFRAELANANAANETAHYYLGLSEMEQGDIVDAFLYFQALDRQDYADELTEIEAQLEKEYLEPAREAARRKLEEQAG